ncbi:MAG: porin [Rubrivivax sp.]|nr:porin [Rubrivivax sp.]
MKLTRSLAVALVASGAAAGAAAQVTLAGIADAAVRHVDNQGRGSVKSLASGGNSTSRLILRGTEDLGGGLSAGFHLEHGILLDSGTQASTTQFWDRRSTVSLASRSLGELRAGRDFVPSYVNWGRYDPFSYVGVASSSNFVAASQTGPIRAAFGTSPNTTVRSSNALQWLSPAGLGGIEGGVMLAAGEGGTAANGQHKVVGGRLGYAQKAFGVSAALTRSENDLTTRGAFKDTALGGSYDFGAARVSLAWRRFDVADTQQTNVLVGAWIPLGASGELKLSWNRADLAGRVGAASVEANDATQLGLGYVHGLSKRTVLYGTLAQVANKGAATFTIAGGPAGLAGGNTSRGVELGVRHVF